MKLMIALSVALVATPVAAWPEAKSLPGVSDKETTIPSTDIRQSVHGHGDVLFVRERSKQWYRIQLNPGCLGGTSSLNGTIFRNHGAGRRIDRFTTVIIAGGGKSCAIQSIRASDPPPQVDSKSKVTLD